MTGSVALDVVIGLVFIYLLYSLLTTLIMEIIATNLGLRAINLREAISKMINDEEDPSLRIEFFNFLNIPVIPRNEKIILFYKHQEICYLGKSIFRRPSAIKSDSFSKVILDYVKMVGEGESDFEKVTSGLDKIINESAETIGPILGKDTAAYVKSLWLDVDQDYEAFKSKLENWFDKTMEQTSEWYKRRVQVILFIVGFFIAWFFNIDTTVLVKKLSVDKDARDQMVQMATAYIENGRYERSAFLVADTTKMDSATLITYQQINADYQQRMDTLEAVRAELREDMTAINSLLGLGSWLPDSITIDARGKVDDLGWIDADLASGLLYGHDKATKVFVHTADKIKYLFSLLLNHCFGYIITALALSLGAPFWFDTLNKLIKLRAAVKGK